ncbi:hypothetical protein ACE6H2_015465 [Prunus campanulata]
MPSFQCLQQFLELVKATGKTRGAKNAATSNISDLTPSKLNNIHHYERGTWQHGYGQAWTKVWKVFFPYNLKGSHLVAIEIDLVNHTATVYDSYSDFTATKKLVGLRHPICDTLARVLYNMHFYEASELKEVKQRGLQMSSFMAFSVCSIGDMPQQRDGWSRYQSLVFHLAYWISFLLNLSHATLLQGLKEIAESLSGTLTKSTDAIVQDDIEGPGMKPRNLLRFE